MATARSMMERMRCRTRRAVSGLVVQMGESASITGLRVISFTPQGAEGGEGVGRKGGNPLRPVLGVPPGVGVLGDVLPRQGLKGGNLGERLLFLLHRQGVAAGLGQGAVVQSLLSGLGQCDTAG